jgi:hypothetical protein
MKKIKLFTIGFVLAGLLTVLTSDSEKNITQLFTTKVANASGTGGPMVLDGMDPVCHSGWESTGGYIARVLKKTHDGASNLNNGNIAIVGSNGTENSCGAPWATMLLQYLAEFEDGSEPNVNFYTTPVEIDNFFNTVISSSTAPAVLWFPDNWSRSSTIENKFTTNAEKTKEMFDNLFNNLKKDEWDVILLAEMYGKNEKSKYPFLNKITDAQTASGYIINKHYYPKLIEVFQKSVDNMTTEKTTGVNWEQWALDQVWKVNQKEDKWFVFNPLMGEQDKKLFSTTETITNYNNKK